MAHRNLPGARMSVSVRRGRTSQAGFRCARAVDLPARNRGANDATRLHGPRRSRERSARPCNRICTRVHGHDRGGELADAIPQGAARVVQRAGRITGYATPIAYFGHAVAETNDDLKALIGGAESIAGPGVLVPARNGDVVRWCLDRGLRVTQMMTLMTMGLYNEPQGPWLPSVIY